MYFFSWGSLPWHDIRHSCLVEIWPWIVMAGGLPNRIKACGVWAACYDFLWVLLQSGGPFPLRYMYFYLCGYMFSISFWLNNQLQSKIKSITLVLLNHEFHKSFHFFIGKECIMVKLIIFYYYYYFMSKFYYRGEI